MQDPVAGESLNIGVVLFDRENRRLLTRFSERYGRLSKVFGYFDGLAYRNLVRHLERRISAVDEEMRQPSVLEEGPKGLDDVFARVFPDELSPFQPSQIMWGAYEDLERRLEELFDQYIARYETLDERERRDESAVWHDVERKIRQRGLHNKVTYGRVVQGMNYSFTFHAGWSNNKPQVLEPISFDLKEGGRIVEKANTWVGRLVNLAKGADFAFTGVLAKPQDKKLEKDFDRAIAMLHGNPNVRSLIPESEADTAMRQIEQDIASH
jgi:hypothetical protein